MDECIDLLGYPLIFLTIDANWGYWKVDIHDTERDKTAFTMHQGLFRFSRVPFGLCYAPGQFRGTMDVILLPLRWQLPVVYLTNIIMFSRDADEHISLVPTVLSLLQKARVTLELKNCSFFTKNIDYFWEFYRAKKFGDG